MRRKGLVAGTRFDPSVRSALGIAVAVAHDDAQVALADVAGVSVHTSDALIHFRLDGIEDVAFDSGGLAWALQATDAGVALWRLRPDQQEARRVVSRRAAAADCALAPGALVERRAGRTRVWTAGRSRTPLPLPLGARRGRVAPWSGGVVWADDAHVYRRPTDGPTRVVGTLPGPAAALWAGAGGAWLAALADGRVALGGATGRPQVLPHAVTGRPAFGRDEVWLTTDAAVVRLDLTTGGVRGTHPGAALAGGTRLLRERGALRTLDGAVALSEA